MKQRMVFSVLLGSALLGFIVFRPARTEAQSSERVGKQVAQSSRVERIETDGLAPCETIECIKQQLETAPAVGTAIRIADGRAAARAVNPKFDELLDRAHKIARDRVLTDVASEEYFSQIAEKLDQGIALDDDSARHTVLDNGTEELLVVAGTESDVRILLGTRNPETGQFEIRVHLVGGGQAMRVVRLADEFALDRESADRAKSEEATRTGDSVVAVVVPTVECFGFSDGAKVRIICVCYSVNSNGISATICFDSGWL